MDISDVHINQNILENPALPSFAGGGRMLAAVTLQTVAVLVPARQTAGSVVDRFRPAPPDSYTTAVIILYLLNFFLGAWIYTKYRTFVRIPMEQLGYWWTLGA